MKTLTAADLDCEFATLSGVRSSWPCDPPKGDILQLDAGETYPLDGPTQLRARDGEEWYHIFLEDSTDAIEGPLMISDIKPYDLAAESRKRNLDYQDYFFVIPLAAFAGVVASMLAHHYLPAQDGVAGTIGVCAALIGAVGTKRLMNKTISAPERLFRCGFRRYRFDYKQTPVPQPQAI